MKRFFFATLALLLLVFCNTAHADMDEQGIILVYMLGCDLENDSMAATNDIHEMIIASKEYNVLFYVYLGGCENCWLPDVKQTHCVELRIEDGNYEIIQDLDNDMSASVQGLERFLNSYADDGSMLIFWGHGNPELQGIGFDALHNNDSLTLPEIHDALKKSGHHFELIGFDACRMASLECASIVTEYADLFAASSSNEQLTGWSYRTLAKCYDMPIVNKLDALRQGLTREQSTTVIPADSLRAIMNPISKALDTMQADHDIDTINTIAQQCEDRKVGAEILTVLDNQVLLIGGDNALSEPDIIQQLLPDIGQSYWSFRNRK